MAKKLPFKVQPKAETIEIGNERIGVIEFPVLGDITVREQQWINEKLSKNSTFLEMARIANKVAKAQKIEPVAAHRFLTTVISQQLGQVHGQLMKLTDREESWKIKFAREIEELSAFLLANQWERQTATAAALIRFRVEGMGDFDVEDAKELSQQLIMEIYGFSLVEQGLGEDGEEVTPEEAEAELRQNLGK